jgi:hypothetical protein
MEFENNDTETRVVERPASGSKTDGRSRAGRGGVWVAGCIVLCGCLPRSDNVPCARDENCSARHPYCVQGVCSAEKTAMSCIGQCMARRVTSTCPENGRGCVTQEENVPVLTGQICAGDGGIPVSRVDFCFTGQRCVEGECQGMRWWTSCDGQGTCRRADDPTDAYKEMVYADAGGALTSECGTQIDAACGDGDSRQCLGDSLVEERRSCDGLGTCAVAHSSADCGLYACGGAEPRCKAQCDAGIDCAHGYVCTESVCHWDWNWVSWAVGDAGVLTASGGVVVDPESGLMWQQGTSDGGMAWDAGIGYCNALVLSGHSDWRLPSRIELLSLVTPERRDPSIDIGVFPGTPIGGFWTAAPYTGIPSYAWYVHFNYGFSYQAPISTNIWVRCVRRD